MLWIWVLFACRTNAQTSFNKADENEIFDVSLGKSIIPEDDFQNVVVNDPKAPKFETTEEQPTAVGISQNFKEFDGTSGRQEQFEIGQHSSGNGMVDPLSGGTMLEKIPVLDGSSMRTDMRTLMTGLLNEKLTTAQQAEIDSLDFGGSFVGNSRANILALQDVKTVTSGFIEKPAQEMTEGFSEGKKLNGVISGIGQTGGDIPRPASEISTFFHSVADGDAVEKLVRDSNSNPIEENLNLFEAHIDSSLNFHTLSTAGFVSALATTTASATSDITANILNSTTGKLSSDTVIWSNPQIFDERIHITSPIPGQEILSVKVIDILNSSIEFICMLPEIVFCVTDLLSDGSYRLRVVYTASSNITEFDLPIIVEQRNPSINLRLTTNVSVHFVPADLSEDDETGPEVSSSIAQQHTGNAYHQAETIESRMKPTSAPMEERPATAQHDSSIPVRGESTKIPKAPVFIFMPHFDHNSYDVYVPEGKNKDPIIVAMIYFLTHIGGAEPTFSIQSEPFQWFSLGEIKAQVNANRLIVAIKLMLREGAEVEFSKVSNGQYKFQIQAKQNSLEATTDINVEILTFATKGADTPEAAATATNPTTTEILSRKQPVTAKISSDPKTISNSDDIPVNAFGIIALNTLILNQTTEGTVIGHSSLDLQTTEADHLTNNTEAHGQIYVTHLLQDIQRGPQQPELSEPFVEIQNPKSGVISQLEESVAKSALTQEELPANENLTKTSHLTAQDPEAAADETAFVAERKLRKTETPTVAESATTESGLVISNLEVDPTSIQKTTGSTGQFFNVLLENTTYFSADESADEKQSSDEVRLEEMLLELDATSATIPGNIHQVVSTHADSDNLYVFQNISTTPQKENSVVSVNAPVIERGHTAENKEFKKNSAIVSSDEQLRSPVTKEFKGSIAAVAPVQNSDDLLEEILENRGSSTHQGLELFINQTTALPIATTNENADRMHRNSPPDDGFFSEDIQRTAGNFAYNLEDEKSTFTTAMQPTNLIVHELSTAIDDTADADVITDHETINSGVATATNTSTDILATLHTDTDIDIEINTSTNIDIKKNTDSNIDVDDSSTTASNEYPEQIVVATHFLPETTGTSGNNIKKNDNFKNDKSMKHNGNDEIGTTDELINTQITTQLESSLGATVAIEQHPEMIGVEIGVSNPEVKSVGHDKLSQDTTIAVNFKTTSEPDIYILHDRFRDADILPDLDIIISANHMDPNDVIIVSVNSTALEVIPHRMQPGKTVFLGIRDAKKLNRYLSNGPIFIEVTASQRTRPSVTSSKIISIMAETTSNEAPTFLSSEYDFHISEGSITGQKVGQMEAQFLDHGEHGIITYQLIGPGSELFAVSGGTVSVSCPSVLPCLDREQTSAYHLLAIATDRSDLNSVPAIVTIYIDDRNDNGPILETSENEITISGGRLTKPFVIKVKDNDVPPNNVNEISTDGTASAFISLEKMRADIYIGRLWSLPATGTYQLDIIAHDASGNNPEHKITVNVHVLNTVTTAHFKRSKHERTVNIEKLFKGNPILQPELENAPLDALRFILLRDDPGWLSVDEYSGNVLIGDVPRTGIASGKYSISVAALNRTDGRLITETILALTVISDNHISKLFSNKLIIKALRKDVTASHQTVEVFPETTKVPIATVRDSISALDEKLHYINVNKNLVSNNNGVIMLDMKKLAQIRVLQFNLSSKEDANDSATVMLFLSSDPTEVARQRKRQSQPRFIHPWRNDMNTIPIKLAENSPEGYAVISLPAYNPMDGSKITDLKLSGEMAQHFTVDGRSGDVQVVTPFDFETMEPESRTFDLILTAGEEPYDTVALLRVEIVDVDDNPPELAKISDYNFENLTIAENSRPGTVLFEVHVSDPDYLYGKTNVFNYALSGNGAANFQVKEVNDTVAVIVSPAADLDREKVEKMLVLLKVTDSGGNSDSITAVITIIDENDNAPVFLHNEYKVEAVENWPAAMVLTRVHAEDKDTSTNANIRYSISSANNQYFEIDPENGLIRPTKALIGLARAHPYEFSVSASDQGIPPLTASTIFSVHVLESTSLSRAGDDKRIHIVSPPVDFTLQLDENIAVNDHVYTVSAKIGGFNEQFGREIKYSIAPVDNMTDTGWFTIDTSSGDLFTLQKLDYELQPTIT